MKAERKRERYSIRQILLTDREIRLRNTVKCICMKFMPKENEVSGKRILFLPEIK